MWRQDVCRVCLREIVGDESEICVRNVVEDLVVGGGVGTGGVGGGMDWT